jgi:hypothetical protein
MVDGHTRPSAVANVPRQFTPAAAARLMIDLGRFARLDRSSGPMSSRKSRLDADPIADVQALLGSHRHQLVRDAVSSLCVDRFANRWITDLQRLETCDDCSESFPPALTMDECQPLLDSHRLDLTSAPPTPPTRPTPPQKPAAKSPRAQLAIDLLARLDALDLIRCFAHCAGDDGAAFGSAFHAAQDFTRDAAINATLLSALDAAHLACHQALEESAPLFAPAADHCRWMLRMMRADLPAVRPALAATAMKFVRVIDAEAQMQADLSFEDRAPLDVELIRLAAPLGAAASPDLKSRGDFCLRIPAPLSL